VGAFNGREQIEVKRRRVERVRTAHARSTGGLERKGPKRGKGKSLPSKFFCIRFQKHQRTEGEGETGALKSTWAFHRGSLC